MGACLCTFDGQTFKAIGECSQHDTADQCGHETTTGGNIKCCNKYQVPPYSQMMNLSKMWFEDDFLISWMDQE